MRVRAAVLAVERWMDDESDIIGMAKGLVVFGIPTALLIILMAWLLAALEGRSAEADCLEDGRGWAIIGHHQEPLLVGKVVTSHTVTDYGCVEVVR
jgi:hypothetical protein